MAITTIDGVLAGMQPPRFFNKLMPLTGSANVMSSLWSLGSVQSFPGPGLYDATAAGAALSSSSGNLAGMLPFPPDAAGGQFNYLSHLDFLMLVSQGTILLCDRLWSNQIPGLTGTQTINSAAWPARDVAGSTNGDGVLIAHEISVTGSGSLTSLSMSYTNSAGTAGQSASSFDAFSQRTGSMVRMGLQSGDTGVRSIQSVTYTGSTLAGGTVLNLVAYRVLAQLEVSIGQQSTRLDFLTAGMVKAFNGTVPYLIHINTSNVAQQFIGTIGWTQG